MKINGYEIIGFMRRNDENAVVLGRRDRGDGFFEFVTGIVAGLPAAEWYWGHYFSNYDEAKADFLNRI